MGPLEFGYQGLPRDPETGLIYFRNRYYDPELGRFITADPKGYVDGPSMYAFESDDPADGSDPMGLTCDGPTCKTAASTAGYLVGLGFSALKLAAAPLINTWQSGKNAVETTQRTVAAYRKGGVAGAKQQMDREGEAAGQQAKESLLGMIPGVNTFRQASKIEETYEKEGPFAGGMQVGATTFSLGTDVAVVYGGVKAVRGARTVEASAPEEPGPNDPSASTPVGRRHGPAATGPDAPHASGAGRNTPQQVNAPNQPLQNRPGAVGGRDYAGHAFDQMRNRGLVPSVVENAIRTGQKSPGKTPGTSVHFDATNNVKVIVNQDGKVVTAE